MTRAEERKRATELKALDARELIKASLPAVVAQMNAAQVDQLQRVLDAAVINADVQKQWDDLDRQAIKGKIVHSNEYLRDPAAVARRDQVLKQKVAVNPGENVLRLDFHKLLSPDALKTTSDNPDEAGYLLTVAEVYEHQGVWLLVGGDNSAMALNLHGEPNDPKRWRLQLLLGYKPGAVFKPIQSDGGRLNQKALLSVSQLGAGYWEFVDHGPTLRALQNAIDRVSFQIAVGLNEHIWWSAHRSEYLATSTVSDVLGRADWPAMSIWSQPQQIWVRGSQLVRSGKLLEGGKHLLLAAYMAEWCGRAVHDYIDATTRGASRAVKILEVAVVCGKISEAILSILAVGQGVIRLLSRKGAASALEAGAERQLTGGQRQLPAAGETTPTPVSSTPKPPTQGASGGAVGGAGAPTPFTGAGSQAPLLPGQFRTDLQTAVNQIRQRQGLPPISGRLAAANEAQLGKVHDEFIDWMAKNPRASLDQKLAQLDRIKTRHGLRLHPD